jgi:hypothetical protein
VIDIPQKCDFDQGCHIFKLRVLANFMSVNRLRDRLHALDGQSYKAYKALRGDYSLANFTLHIDYVQGDPFAVAQSGAG